MFRVKYQDTIVDVPRPATSSVYSIKQHLAATLGITIDHQRLIARGKVLTDDVVPVPAVHEETYSAVLLVRPSDTELQAMENREAEAKRIHDAK